MLQIGRGFKCSKLTPSHILPAEETQLIPFPEELHQLWAKCSNTWTCGHILMQTTITPERQMSSSLSQYSFILGSTFPALFRTERETCVCPKHDLVDFFSLQIELHSIIFRLNKMNCYILICKQMIRKHIKEDGNGICIVNMWKRCFLLMYEE